MTDSSDSARLEAALAVGAAISAVHFGLTALMEQVHGEGDVSSGRRAVLANLEQLGPRTVPQLAAMRPVSRQYVQRLADALEADGLVEKAANPASRRSALLAITPAGRARLAQMRARERPVLESLARTLEPAEASVLLAMLSRVRAGVHAELERLSDRAT